jgi:nitric oxide reductase subunit B
MKSLAMPISLARLGLSTANVKYRSQLVAYPYLLVSALLFTLQIIFGLTIAAQYVWPDFLVNSLAFNVGRATHLNLLVFWLLLALMGASYYLIPEEAEAEIFSVRLAYVQLGILVLAGLGTLFSFWFLGQSQGKPFTESPMPWPVFVVAGAVLFLINIGLTLFRARRWTAISIVLFAGMAGLSILYLSNFIFFGNLTEDYYWWWWIIHLWVEGAWELIAAALMAYLLIKLTGVERSKMQKWLYVEVALALFTGIVGTGHHYYWIGTPAYWLWWGAIFSALEPVPIVLMTYDALMTMRHRQTQPSNQVTWYWLGGSAIAHFVGAGVYGFAQTLPQINQWTHGTQITASHGHFAFFGAFGMLALAAIYYVVPQLRGIRRLREGRGLWSFWLMTLGMLGIILSFTIAGIVQVYLNRMVGLPFMTVRTQFITFWLFWVFIFGLVLFLPGVLIYLRDFFGLEAATDEIPVSKTESNLVIFPLMLLAVAALLAAIWAGWVRLGWAWPVWQPKLILAHGPLMISAFLGSLIALERAVALQQRWMFAGPLLSGLGGVALMLGIFNPVSGTLIGLGGLVFIAIMVVIVRRHTALYTVTMLIGVLAWEVGNILWLTGWPVYRLVLWWMTFLILTIVAERLELGRLVRLPRSAEILFVVAAAVLLAGCGLSVVAFDFGVRLAGAGMVALSLWLWRYDIARRTVRKPGLPRFAAVCLLSGYVWLGICGLVGLLYGGVAAGPHYDAFLHTVLIGFVISMIFGHAPIIFPAVLRLPISYSPIFYVHLILLHLSLAIRLTGDLAPYPPLRLWGGLLNGIAILLFFASTAYVVATAPKANST